MNFDQDYYRRLGRDLRKSAEDNRLDHVRKMDGLQRDEDFAAAERLFWVGVASVVVFVLVYNYFTY